MVRVRPVAQTLAEHPTVIGGLEAVHHDAIRVVALLNGNADGIIGVLR